MSIAEFKHPGRVAAFLLRSNDANIFIERVWCLPNCENMMISQKWDLTMTLLSQRSVFMTRDMTRPLTLRL